MNTKLAASLRAIRTELNATFIQRHAAIEAMFLAVLAKEHAYILGPPGTGKSDLARNFIGRIVGAKYFEMAGAKTLPEAVALGDVDVMKWRDTGVKLRAREGYITTCHFAFIDEIGKMSPILGHHILAALNERIRHEVENGVSHHPIPLMSAITASNELLVKESEDGAALWDRLLVRTTVDYITDTAGFVSLLKRDFAPATTVTTVDFAELSAAIDTEVPAVTLTDATIDAVIQVRKGIADAHIVVSDRRWRQAMKVIRAHAWLDGRDSTNVSDLSALDYVLWQTPDQIDTVRRIRVAVADPLARDAMVIRDFLAAITAELEARRGMDETTRFAFGREATTKRRKASRDVEKLQKAYADAGLDGTDQVLQLKAAIDSLEDLTQVICFGS